MSHQDQAGQVRLELDRFEEWFIMRKAWELVNKCGFPVDDVEDIQQEIRLDVLRCLQQLDEDKSARHTYVVMVARYRALMIHRGRYAVKNNRGRPLQSLNDTALDDEGNEVEVHELLDGDARYPIESDRDREERRDLILDVRRVVASLPDHLQRWCTVFSEVSIREASREFGIPLSQLRQIKAEIRVAFEAAGLDAYLQKK